MPLHAVDGAAVRPVIGNFRALTGKEPVLAVLVIHAEIAGV